VVLHVSIQKKHMLKATNLYLLVSKTKEWLGIMIKIIKVFHCFVYDIKGN